MILALPIAALFAAAQAAVASVSSSKPHILHFMADGTFRGDLALRKSGHWCLSQC